VLSVLLLLLAVLLSLKLVIGYQPGCYTARFE
jgi:hypothetical protein